MKQPSEIIHTIHDVLGTPLRAFITGIALALSAATFIGWPQHEQLIEFYFGKKPLVKVNNFDARTAMLKMGGDVLIVWELDVANNLRYVRRFESITYGTIHDLEDEVVPIFSDSVNENAAYRKLIAGSQLCDTLIPTSRIGVLIATYSVKYLCRGPIVNSTGLTVGYVTVGFKLMPTNEAMSIIMSELTATTKLMGSR